MEDYQKLETLFAEYIGTEYAVACSSGTAALTLTVAGLVKEGEEVIVPEFTMIATAWAVTYNRAVPVFVDCGDDLNIDVNKIEEKITSKTKAIIATHIYGRPANMERILDIAEKHDLLVIEDACEAHGASILGQKVGGWSDAGCFSFYKNKIISSEEGGIITTNNKELADLLRDLRSMAFGDKHDFLHHRIGFNFRMTNMQAKKAIQELEKIDEKLAIRRDWANYLDGILKEKTIGRPAGSVIWVYDILCENEKERDEKMKFYENEGYKTRHFFKPMSMQPMYLGDFENLKAFDFSKRGFYIAYS